MDQVAVENRANLAETAFRPLARILSAQTSIKHTLDWLVGHSPPLDLNDMITQDEYSHDFLISYPGGLWLVYDST